MVNPVFPKLFWFWETFLHVTSYKSNVPQDTLWEMLFWKSDSSFEHYNPMPYSLANSDGK